MALNLLMVRGRSCWPATKRLALLLCSLAIMAAGGKAARAEPADERELFEAHLAAGEFAPAMALAVQSDAGEREKRLGLLARSQARAGARDASLETLRSMRDDTERQRVLGEVGAAGAEPGARGGGVEPDFESLIDLITSTIEPTSWDEVGGPGAIQEFEGGVRVDALGTLHPVTAPGGRLARLHREAVQSGKNADVRQPSPMRKVSLPRLEREVQLRLAAGAPLDEEMLLLAGLQRVEYVLVYPETGDLVLAGPAGDWTIDRENRLVSSATGRPVVRLDDLVVLLRHYRISPDGTFGCSITPTQEGLAKAQGFLQQSASRPLKAGQRSKWLDQLRSELGRQNVEVFGIDPRTRVAQIIVEADYRMKLVGIGLEEGTPDVPSYLEMIELAKGQPAPPMDVLRWWFTLNYDAVLAAPGRDVFELRGQGVKVLSENELLTAQGERVPTGKSDLLNRQFAERFTRHFGDLASKYPVYAELQNVFDLALVAALMRAEGLADRTGWHVLCFGDPNQYAVAVGNPPKSVETVVNHRVFHRTQIVAAVSGGVRFDPSSLVAPEAIDVDHFGKLGSEHARSAPETETGERWWWD